MAKHSSSVIHVFYVSFILACIFSLLCVAVHENPKLHIVYMGSLPKRPYSPTFHHLSILQQVFDGSKSTSSLIHSYKRSFNGFAAMLTDQQKQKVTQMEGVISVFPSGTLQLHTTRSWDFMGFPQSVKRNQIAESDAVIGVFDTGIWPESESFSDHGFGSIPQKWKGTCAGGKNFTCNKKVIGARFYVDESARDSDGHGTHTASIAAGNEVNNVSFYGLAQGTARGGVPSARVAVYKVCNTSGCNEASVLAAFDDAIADGVDIISISMGKNDPFPFEEDVIAIGSFHAMAARAILTVNSAGNNGPDPSTVSSLAPWILTVASNTIDRQIIDKVVLGNGKTLYGNSVNSFTSNETKFPIALKNGDSKECPKDRAEDCDCLDSTLVKGKIVLCPYPDGQDAAKNYGAIGAITEDDGEGNASYVTPLPSLTLFSNDYALVISYTNSTKDPQAEILKSEIIKDLTAPRVAESSSRGPNSIVSEILKPDISAPGVDILAAYSPIASPSDNPQDKRSVKYNILTGTSMACPHVSAIALYLKTFHPDWSPAAIKSAIMTSAQPMNGSSKDQIGEYAYGSGHVNPVQAINPGLIYDIGKEDYIQMLCNLGYNNKKIKSISGENIHCSGAPDRSLVRNLNYPAFAIQVQPMVPFNVTFNRTVTNVGKANSSYKATVIPNPNSKIIVTPNVLSFKSLNEKRSFVVTIIGGKIPSKTLVTSSLIWSDGTYHVRHYKINVILRNL